MRDFDQEVDAHAVEARLDEQRRERDAAHINAIREVARLQSENHDLRQWLCDVLKALGNGSGASPECSLQFLAHIPEEVRLVVADLRKRASA